MNFPPTVADLIYFFCDRGTKKMLNVTYPNRFEESEEPRELIEYACNNNYVNILHWAIANGHSF